MAPDKKQAFIVHSMTVEDENGKVFFINLGDNRTCVQTNGEGNQADSANMMYRAGKAIGAIHQIGYEIGK